MQDTSVTLQGPVRADSGGALVQMEREDCLRLESALGREWVETDGCGGYASSTSLLCPTRRYHGLLVTVPPEHTKRHLLLSRFEESMHRTGRSFELSMARYGETWHPTGYSAIESFALVPYPSWRYRIGSVEVVREILMVRGAPIVLSRYRLEGERDDIELRLRPLLPFREADQLTFENLHLHPKVERVPRGVLSRPYPELPPLRIELSSPDAVFEADPTWYRGIEYGADLARGYDGHEDQFSPGWFSVVFRPGEDVVVAATTLEDIEDPRILWEREAARRRTTLLSSTGTHPVQTTLGIAADDYLYSTPSARQGVIAGFPWFGEWGRDTCIALPGLLLARGRVEACGDALEGMVPYLQGGLLPNVFGSGRDDSDYGSADASLWFARAVRLYEKAGGSRDRLLQTFLPALRLIAGNYRDGTALGIGADDQGLLRTGGSGRGVTWMDAVTDSGAVTPRDGCAVELNALWYSLLTHIEKLEEAGGDRPAAREQAKQRRQLARSFLGRFWLRDEGYLADTWCDGEVDTAVRPNMVIAAALEFSPLSRGQRTDVVLWAARELLTSRGLRTLAPDHPLYKGRYQGGMEERDEAYHQGTVWPWLLGFFCEAYLRAYGFRRKRIAYVRSLLDGFAPHLEEAGLGQVSEVFDGDPPHHPGGTVAQAWSVSELLRAYRMLEDRRL